MTETQGIPGEWIIALFLIYGLYLSARWGGLTALITVALRLEIPDERPRKAV
jgi:hypothetical protein